MPLGKDSEHEGRGNYREKRRKDMKKDCKGGEPSLSRITRILSGGHLEKGQSREKQECEKRHSRGHES